MPGLHGPVWAAKQVKHAGFVVSKRAAHALQEGKWRVLTVVNPLASRAQPYTFRPERYRRSFILRPAPAINVESQLPRRVFTLWTGSDSIPPIRARSLEVMRERIGVPVELITPSTLGRWEVSDHPFHPAMRDLSFVHQSDYLRAYLLHHHGGGYIDLKEPLSSWAAAFDRVEGDESLWLAAYGEGNAKASTRLPGRMGRDISINYRRLVGPGAIIARSHTRFTAEWIREVERRLDYYAPQLAEFPGDARGSNVGYPIAWTHLLGRVYQPLQLKYLDRIRPDDSLTIVTEHYRDD